MQSKGKLVAAAMATVMGVGISGVALESRAAPVEKCYGVVKAGKNSCGNSKHACSAQAKIDADGTEWVFLPKGTCDKIAGGSLTPITAPASGLQSSPSPAQVQPAAEQAPTEAPAETMPAE